MTSSNKQECWYISKYLWVFFVFTALLIAELKIMFKQIKIGPKEGGH